VKNVIQFIEEEDDLIDEEEVEEGPPEEVMAILQSKSGWKDLDPAQTRIPPLSIKHIHQYFIQHRIRKEHVTATKPFEKGYRIFAAKKVKSLSTHSVKPNSVYCIIRAAVLPSQRKDRIYETSVALYTTTASVYCAHCTCVAGKSGTCNHVAALMFAIDDYNREVSTQGNKGTPSCTSIPAAWGVPSKKSSSPVEVENMQIVKPAIGKIREYSSGCSKALFMQLESFN